MKFFLLPALLATLGGIGAYRLAPDDSCAAPTSCPTEDCNVTVECTPRGTCLVVCRDEDGRELCRQELPCDQECDRPCDAPKSCSQR